MAQFQRAVRAPNIGELFAAATNGFPTATDPCSSGFGSFSPATIVSTCTATGVPAANVGTGFQSNGQIQTLGGGNPTLFQEKGDTLTIGMVWQPSAIDGLTMQVDYYDIEIKDAITVIPLQTVLNECHLQNIGSQCAIIGAARNPATGELGGSPATSPLIGTINAGTINTSGIDVNVSYSFDIGPGVFTAQYYGTYILNFDFQSSPTSNVVPCEGLFGPQVCVGGNEPAPEYKHTAQFGYNYGPLTTSVRWRVAGVRC